MTNPTFGYTKSGKPIDDALVEELADEADVGYDVDEIVASRGKRGRPRPGSTPSTVDRHSEAAWRRASDSGHERG